MDITLVRANRIAAVAALVALVGALAVRGPTLAALLVIIGGVLVLPVTGVLLRATLPTDRRAEMRAGRVSAALWPWTLGLRGLSRARTVAVLPVTVMTLDGGMYRCGLRGRPVPGDPGRGAAVDVFGRRQRDGTIRVRQFVDTTTGDTVRGRIPFVTGLSRIVSVASATVWTLVGVGLLWLLLFAG